MQNTRPLRFTPAPGSGASFTLRQTLRYINRFGLRGGMQAARVRTRQRGDGVASKSSAVAVRLPFLAHPLWVRPGTSDVETFDEVFMAREYDLPLEDFSPQHVLDVGANVGCASVLFAMRWPAARIVALEPAADNMELLKRNTGPYPGITAIRGAVWSHATEVTLANPTDAPNAYQVSDYVDPRAERIPAYTIPQLIERLGCARLDLLKMDVEGAEAEILRDAATWLDRIAVMVIELHDRLVPGCAEALNAALHGRHYRQEIVGQNLLIDLR